MSVSGTFAVTTRTPLGEQRGSFIILAEGAAFTGRVENPTGSMAVENGRVAGNRLTWTMRMTAPMPMSLDCEAVIVGDTITGTVRAGVLGAMALSGTRAG